MNVKMSEFMCLLLLLILLLLARPLHSRLKFTNLQCEAVDSDFCAFSECKIKALNRTTNLINLRASLFKKRINNITVNIDIRKRANGYKPFLYNVTFDACRFLKDTNKYTLVNFIYNMVQKYSNFNHTCPYEGDLIIANLPSHHLESTVLDMLPVPAGRYGVFTTWLVHEVPRATFNVFATVS